MGATDGPFAVEVIADSSEEWAGNALRFPTTAAAEVYAKDLYSRWTSVRSWRVVEYVRAGWGMFKNVERVGA